MPKIVQLVGSGLSESLQLLGEYDASGRYSKDDDDSRLVAVKPGAVGRVQCTARSSSSPTSSTGLEILVAWDPPWNSATVESYGVLVEQKDYEFRTSEPSFVLRSCEQGAAYDIWVRAFAGKTSRSQEISGVYSERATCLCEAGKTSGEGPQQ